MKYQLPFKGTVRERLDAITTMVNLLAQQMFYGRVKEQNNVNGIAFVAMAESGTIDSVTAGEHPELFAEWAYPVDFKPGQMRRDPLDGCLYQVNDGKGHTSQEGWPPSLTPDLWHKASDPAEEWPEWSQPIGAHDTYDEGDKTTHNEKRWISDYNDNVWEPGVFGWTEYVEAEE